jgi:type I restriction enzyme S subunit
VSPEMAAARLGGWRNVTVGDVVTLQRGFDITKAEQSEGPYPVVSSSGPTSTHSMYKVLAPGVIIGRKGLLGGVYFSDTSFWPHDTTLWVKDFHSNDPKFVYYWLQTLDLGRYDVGASNPTLNRNHVHLLPTLIPGVKTQRKIGTILSAYDGLIENHDRQIKILEEIARRIYREWFVEFRYPGHEDVPLVDSELGPIPEGWVVRRLGDLVSQSRATLVPRGFPNELFELYSIPSFDEWRQPRLERGSAINSNKFLVSCPCILYSKLNPRIPRVWLATRRSDYRALSSTELLVLYARRDWNLPIIYSLLLSEAFVDRIAGISSGTSNSHQRVRPNELFAVQVSDPGADLCHQFEQAVGGILSLAEQLRSIESLLRASRDVLLPRLTSGEIDVTGLDIAMPTEAAE